MARNISLDAPLDELKDAARAKFGELAFEPVTIGDTTLRFVQVGDMTAYIDKLVAGARGDQTVQLPLWARIWPTALLMSFLLQRMPLKSDGSLLEVGGGVGVCGLFAAARGLRSTITDIEPDALLFSRINILENGLEDRAEVAVADFTTTRLGKTFDYVVGCEIVYQPKFYADLAEFLLDHLAPEAHAEILLAMEIRATTEQFFQNVKDRVRISRRAMPLPVDCDEGEERIAHVFRMARSGDA